MLTTLVASSKGGCGKSTLVTQLASHWAQAGQRTAIVDADHQGSSYRWASRRPLPGNSNRVRGHLGQIKHCHGGSTLTTNRAGRSAQLSSLT